MQATALLRHQFREFHQLLEGTLADVVPDHVHEVPPGTANPVGATYAHVVLWEDMGIHGLLQGRQPLSSSGAWAGRTGLSEPPPLDSPGHWEEWSRRVRVDLPALRTFAQAVYQATDAYFATLPDEELEGEIDLTAMGFGRPIAAWVITNMLQNVALHCGEVAFQKGLHGETGYPVPIGAQPEPAAG